MWDLADRIDQEEVESPTVWFFLLVPQPKIASQKDDPVSPFLSNCQRRYFSFLFTLSIKSL